jgi:hypothetical protein
MAKSRLKYVETEGGPFVLLPLELKTAWKGTGDDDEEDEGESDYDRAEAFLSSVGVLDVGKGKALILGEAEVTGFRPLEDGGVFVQKVFGDEPADVDAAVDAALASGKWKVTKHVLPIEGKGKLALFDAAYAYADADSDEVLKLTLAPATYGIETARAKTKDVEAGLVRLRRKA